MAVMLFYAGGFAFVVWVSTKLICTDCGAANPFDSRFCEQCGAAVAVSLSA